MAHEDKAMDSLDKILDVIWREEGRLAIINRYGSLLNEEEKVQATQLITSQKTNMDRLFGIYKNELLPLMQSIYKNSEEMNVLFDKLVSSSTDAKEMIGEQNVPVENTAVVNTESSMTGTDAVTTDNPVYENTISAEAAGNNAAVAENSIIQTEAVVGETNGDSQVNLGDLAASSGVSDNSGVVADANTFVSDNTISSAASDNPLGISSESADVNTESSSVVLSGMEEDTPSSFVLSPIDEDVAPAMTEEEAKKAEETIAASEQQLGAIDAVKADIMASTELTEDEKADKLEQYARMTDATVKAILVTKAQCERLLASRLTQKALLKPNTGEVKDGSAEVSSDVVAALPDFTAGEGGVLASAAEVSTETNSDAAGSASGVVEEKVESASGDDLVLPMIGGAEAPANDSQVAALPVTESASDLVLNVPGATNNENAADGRSKQNELQAMIEQANTLYKDGKTAEAQALFEKIGTMNQGAQGESASGEVVDAAVLVKK